MKKLIMMTTRFVNDIDRYVITSKFSPHALVTPLLQTYPEQVSPAGNLARKAHTSGRWLVRRGGPRLKIIL